jgi:predicted DNA-binding transcriptional regulator YafY
MRVYGLDRVITLELTDTAFRMPRKFDVDELFSTSFGIYIPEEKGKTITFRATATEARFLRDLPIHRSQTEIEKKDGFVTFSIFACPNKALIMEFCKYGSNIEVLSPAEVRDSVAEEHAAALKHYR